MLLLAVGPTCTIIVPGRRTAMCQVPSGADVWLPDAMVMELRLETSRTGGQTAVSGITSS
jgi:hypothetical protein